MGVSTHDIFGNAEGAQPALPGSYGEPPSGFRLPSTTRLGPVRLQIADLDRSVAYYEGTLGMRVIEREGSRALMGAQSDGAPLVELNERPGARPIPRRGRLGLFHFAILLPDRPALGRLVSHLEDLGVQAGAGDHLVSESFYLQDPDNLGIEVYADRPQSTWRRIGRELMMATDPVDVAGVVESAGDVPWSGMPGGTVMGHLHLHVGGIAAASAFYSEALGFDRTVWEYPGALFLAAGGYHHHLGTNTWAGPNATPPASDEARLLEWTIQLPDEESLAAAGESLARAGHGTERLSPAAMVTRDPWGTQLLLQVVPASGVSHD